MPARLSAVHRKLIFSLILAAVLLSSLLGTASYLYERRQLQKQVMEMAQIGIEVLRSEAPRRLGVHPGTNLKQPDQQFMADLARNPPHTDLGRFAFVALYDPSQRELGRAVDSTFPDAQHFADLLARLQPGRSASEIELGDRITIGKAHGLPFGLAIANDQGQTIGYVKGVFVPSEKTEADMQRTARRASALAVVFVFVTSLFIYPIIRSLIVKLEKQSMKLLYANFDTIRVLGSAIAKRDSDTDTHNYRVTIYAIRLAESVGLGANEIRTLIKGAFLHDVGKIGVPDAILHKAGPLTDAEIELMQGHVRYGLDIVGGIDWLADAASIVGCHHEKYDGSGYPNHLAGEAIPITARIFAIADVFDALTAERPYKKALIPDEAMAIMRRDAGRHFDPALFAKFEPLAPALFTTLHQQEETLRRMLSDIARHYFQNMLKEIQEEAIELKRPPA